MSVADVHSICKYDEWFLERIKHIVDTEAALIKSGLPHEDGDWLRLKKMGFSDARIGTLTNTKEEKIRKLRHASDIRPVFKRVDTSAAEIPSATPYMYSCYEGDGLNPPESECAPTNRNKIIILGGGPTVSARALNSIIAAFMPPMR